MDAKQFTQFVVAAVLIITAPTSTAYNPPQDKDLKATMTGLLVNMQTIMEGIMRDDYHQISNMAEDIAFHPEPSPQKRMEIARELGIEMLTFKMFRDSLRQSALELKKAAEKESQQSVIEAYTDLIKNCSACHNNYRKQLRKNLKTIN